jgi:hypothetical protein
MNEGETKKSKSLRPLPETKKHMGDISQARFKSILRKAITTPVPRRAAK